MKPFYILILSIVISSSTYANLKKTKQLSATDFINVIELVGQQQLHLHQAFLQQVLVKKNKDNFNSIDREIVFAENTLKKLKAVAKKLDNSDLKLNFKKIEKGLRSFKKTIHKKSPDYQVIKAKQLFVSNELNKLLNNINNIEVHKFASNELLDIKCIENEINNIQIIDNQLIELVKYNTNKELLVSNISNKLPNRKDKTVSNLNSAINELILNNFSDISYDIKITTLISLIDHLDKNNKHKNSLINDISLLLESLKGSHLNTLKSNIYKNKSSDELVTL